VFKIWYDGHQKEDPSNPNKGRKDVEMKLHIELNNAEMKEIETRLAEVYGTFGKCTGKVHDIFADLRASCEAGKETVKPDYRASCEARGAATSADEISAEVAEPKEFCISVEIKPFAVMLAAKAYAKLAKVFKPALSACAALVDALKALPQSFGSEWEVLGREYCEIFPDEPYVTAVPVVDATHGVYSVVRVQDTGWGLEILQVRDFGCAPLDASTWLESRDYMVFCESQTWLNGEKATKEFDCVSEWVKSMADALGVSGIPKADAGDGEE